MDFLTWHAKLGRQASVCCFIPQWVAKNFYQILNGVHDQKEVKKHSMCTKFRDEIIWPWQRGGGCGSGEYEWNSPPKANGAFCIIFSL